MHNLVQLALLSGITDNWINWVMESNLSRFTSPKLLCIPNVSLNLFAYWYHLVKGISYGFVNLIVK